MPMNVVVAHCVVVAAIVASFAIRLPYERLRRRNRITDDRSRGQERWLMALVFVGMVPLPLLAVCTDVLAFADYRFSPTIAWVGAFLIVPSLWLFRRSHADLAEHWSPTLHVHDAQTIVTRGVYARIRHPMYAAIRLWATAQALLIANWIVGPAALVSFAALYLLRVPREEQMMLEHFGPAYRDYMRRTDRLVPGIL